MKSKLHLSAATFFFLALSSACSLAQVPVSTGAPAPQPMYNPQNGMPIDPQTGIPIPQPTPEWKDPAWQDPDITLTNVFFDGLTLSEVARVLTDEFKEQFDIVLPGVTSGVANQNGQPVIASWQNNWRDEQILLRLKNVTASEIFNAMNLLFEDNRTPLRWELKINGHRQMALLRVLVDPTPPSGPPDSVIQRRVYFVGNLIGDEKSGGMTMEQIISTITDVWKMADSAGGTIQFHKEAQLLVVTGTPTQIDFMQQTLSALNQKVDLQKIELAHPERHSAKPTVPSNP